VPYIKPKDRSRIFPKNDNFYKLEEIKTTGDLNYTIFRNIKNESYENPKDLEFQILSLGEYFFNKSEKRYGDINDVIGALTCCKLEYMRVNRPCFKSGGVVIAFDSAIKSFYKKIAVPYELEKLEQNGDVEKL